MKRLYLFDMDGTLLRGTTACLELARTNGTERRLLDLELQFGRGELTTKDFARAIHESWGVLPAGLVEEAFMSCPKLANIDIVMQRIRASGDVSCLISMAPLYFARRFTDLGFDYVYASRFPAALQDTFDPSLILDSEDKPRIAREVARRTDCLYRHSVAFGDSMSDYPLFRDLVHTVCVNGDDRLQALARYRYDGEDLLEAFEHVEARLRLTTRMGETRHGFSPGPRSRGSRKPSGTRES